MAFLRQCVKAEQYAPSTNIVGNEPATKTPAKIAMSAKPNTRPVAKVVNDRVPSTGMQNVAYVESVQGVVASPPVLVPSATSSC